MKLSKNLGRIATTFLATAMLASVAAVPAFAEGAIESVPIGKTVTTDGNTFAPKADYTFKVDNGDAGTYTYKEGKDDAEASAKEVMAGIGGLTVTGTSSKPSGDTPTTSYELKDATISIDADTFKSAKPGIYHYVLSEVTGNVKGMTYDTSKYDLYVYVLNGETGVNDHYVAYVVAVEQVVDNDELSDTYGELIPGTDKATEIAFVNDYDTNNTQLHDVTITKSVQGTMGDKVNDTFNINVSVTGDDGEVFYIEYKTSQNDQVQKVAVNSGASTEIKGLKDTGTITIYSLDADDTYQVVENTNGSGKGYDVYVDSTYTANESYDANTDGKTEKKNDTGKVPMGNADQNIAFYNVKNGNVATGVMMDIAPYALLVVVAAAGCFVFLRKRRED